MVTGKIRVDGKMMRLAGLVVGSTVAMTVLAEPVATPGLSGWYIAEGSGCLVWKSDPEPRQRIKAFWSGQCDDNNRASGQGDLVWRYFGWHDEKVRRYVGRMLNGRPDGRGTFVWMNGPDGDRYEGDWVDGTRTGRGTYVWGTRIARGTYSWETGDRYEGDFVDDKRTGNGTFVWANGDRYEGNFVDDKRTGRGTYVWSNGDRYEGDWLDGTRTGRGTFVWADGDRYEGEWIDNKQDGVGKMTKANGDWYNGEWSGNFADGEGEASISGKQYKGIWARGCLRSREQRAAWGRPRHECPY